MIDWIITWLAKGSIALIVIGFILVVVGFILEVIHEKKNKGDK